MRTIGVVTTSRADYGIYRPLLRAIQDDPELELWLLVSGMHLSPEFGLTVEEIQAEGFPVSERVESLVSSDTPQGVALSLGLGVSGFARALARRRPDLLVVLGDRFEMFAAALAALPFNLPVTHLFGGELTQGAMDDSLRHAMTKLSHLHFVATEEYARRVIQLGEEPWRVTVCGALSLDNLNHLEIMGREELEAELGISLREAPLLVTFHPVSLEYQKAGDQTRELLAALDQIARTTIFTLPNADTGGREVSQLIREFVADRPWAHIRDNLGTRRYFSLLALAAAMVGNSSSGIIEAPCFRTPVVNLGTRQKGRVRAANVIDVAGGREETAAAIRRAISPEFRESLANMANPYGGGRAAEVIVSRLKEVPLDQRLIAKGFYDLTPADQG